MSVKAIGTDIVSISRIGSLYERFGHKFVERILTENEIQQMPEPVKGRIAYLSKRWAAKEAIAKAFGSGINEELSFGDMEISHLDSGQPFIKLNHRAKKLAKKKGLSTFHISISDEKKYAVAFVVASTEVGV